MKKHIYAFSAIASAILMAAGCQMAELELETVPGTENLEINEESEGGNFSVTFEGYQEQTRTEFHESTIWWSAGDQVLFGQYTKIDDAWKMKTSYNTGLSESVASFRMTISSFNTPAADTTTAYFSVYPKSAYMGFAGYNGIPFPRITLKSVQAPNAANFDPTADLLISKLVLSQADTAITQFKLNYTRPCSIAKMAITNLPSEEAIESIKFSATKGGLPVTLTGSLYYDITEGTFAMDKKSNYCNDVKDVTLDYTNCEITGDMTAYFVCYPFELGKDDTFTVVVTTKDGNSYTKFITLGEDDALSFKPSLATQFTVDMTSSIATGVSWCGIKVYDTSVTSIYYQIECSDEVESFTRGAFKKSSWLALTPEQQSSKLDSAKVGTLNAKINLTGVSKDTRYIIAAKVTNKSGKTAIIMKETGTTWVGLRAATRNSGGILVQITSNVLAYGTKTFKAVRTSELEGITDLEAFYSGTVKPANIAQSNLDAINSKDEGTSTNYAITKDYKDEELIPDESYTVMMKFLSKTGDIEFRTFEAIAK